MVTQRERQRLLILNAGWPGVVILLVFLVVATSPWWMRFMR